MPSSNDPFLNEEIIGNPPPWVVRSGTVLIVSILFLLFLASYFIKYPESISSEITIVSTEKPIALTARVQGNLILLGGLEGKPVAKGDTMGYIKDIMDIKYIKLIDQLVSSPENRIEAAKLLLKIEELGLFKSEIQNLVNDLERLEQFKKLNTESITLNKLTTEKRNLLAAYEYDLKLIKREKNSLQIAIASFQRDSMLYLNKVISTVEYEKALQTLHNSKYTHDEMVKEIMRKELALAVYDIQHEETSRAFKSKLNDHNHNIEKTIKDIDGLIENWVYERVLTAPIDGYAHLHRIWENHQQVNNGVEVIYVIPESKKCYAFSYVKQSGFGKVKIGDPVNIKLQDFPYLEFGVVKGVISEISPVYTEEGYLVKVDIPHSLRTSFNKEVAFTHDMRGTCEIITNDTRLILRLFNQLKYVFSG